MNVSRYEICLDTSIFGQIKDTYFGTEGVLNSGVSAAVARHERTAVAAAHTRYTMWKRSLGLIKKNGKLGRWHDLSLYQITGHVKLKIKLLLYTHSSTSKVINRSECMNCGFIKKEL